MIDIGRIKESVDLPTLIGETVALKKNGNVFLGRCPFHEEKTPSFAVYPNRFHCFGCGEQGDAIDWISKRHSVDFRRATEILGGGQTYDSQAPVLIKRERQVTYADPVPVWERGDRSIGRIRDHAASLEVATSSLVWLDVAFSVEQNAWMFPQRAADGSMIGIRFRNERGEKWSLKNGRAGLFLPNASVDKLPVLYIAEGPTDTAALLTLGFYAIGRASCLGQEEMICEFVKRNGIRRVVIVSDNDRAKKRSNGETFRPGLEGAAKLQGLLPCSSCLLLSPDGTKDIREWASFGGTARVLESYITNQVWTNPK